MVSLTPSYSPVDGVTSAAANLAPAVDEKLVLQPPSLALLVFLLIPCVVLLFFLNCFLLFHRLPAFSMKKRGKRRGALRGHYPCIRVNESGHTSLGPNYIPTTNKQMRKGRCQSDSISQGLEATLALEEGMQWPRKQPQSRDYHNLDGTPCGQNCCPMRPSCTLSMPHYSYRRQWNPDVCVVSRERMMGWDQDEDHGGTGSSCDLDTHHHPVPPNTPAAAPGVIPKVKFSHKTSSQKKPQGGQLPSSPVGSLRLDRVSSIPQDTSDQLSTSYSLPGPGLDSDFGVSAGISLHILSSDSDSCSRSWTSGMEWDYYDPCYMRRNRLRGNALHNRHLPVICSKQYWI